MVFPSVSFRVLIGESDRTYQNRSPAPVVSAPRMRTGEHCLLRLPTPLGVEELKVEPMFFEDPGALAELGHRRVPVAALADRELQRVLRRRLLRSGEESRQRSDSPGQGTRLSHLNPPSGLIAATERAALVVSIAL